MSFSLLCENTKTIVRKDFVFYSNKKIRFFVTSLIRHDRIIIEQTVESIFAGLEIETRIHVRKLQYTKNTITIKSMQRRLKISASIRYKEIYSKVKKSMVMTQSVIIVSSSQRVAL